MLPTRQEQPIESEELAKQITRNLLAIEAQVRLRQRSGERDSDAMKLKVEWGEGDVLYGFAEKFKVSDDIKQSKPNGEDFGSLLSGTLHKTLTNITQAGASKVIDYNELTAHWSSSVNYIQGVAQSQYNELMLNKVADAAKLAVTDPAHLLKDVIGQKIKGIVATAKAAIDAANQAMLAYYKDPVKSSKHLKEVEQASYAANVAMNAAMTAIPAEAVRLTALCQEVVNAKRGLKTAEVADEKVTPKAITADEAKKTLKDAMDAAIAAGISDAVVNNLPSDNTRIPVVPAIDAATIITPIKAECNKKLTDINALQNTQAGSLFQQELAYIQRTTESQRVSNASALHKLPSLHKEFETILLTDKDEKREQKEQEKVDDKFNVKGENQLEELESGIYKKEDKLSGKTSLVNYDSDSHTACPIPMTGRATGFSFLDKSFTREWRAAFDRVAANFGTLVVSVNPEKDNMRSLKAMVAIAMEHKDKYVEVNKDCLEVLAQTMSTSKFEKYLTTISEHNAAVKLANTAPYREVIKEDDAKKIDNAKEMLGARIKEVETQLTQIREMEAKPASVKSSDDHVELAMAVTHLATALEDLGGLIEAKSKSAEGITKGELDGFSAEIAKANATINAATVKIMPEIGAMKMADQPVVSDQLSKSAKAVNDAQMQVENIVAQQPAAPGIKT